MSLLMDALKKAEQEKKEAARRQDQPEVPESENPDAEVRPPRKTLDDTDTWGQEIVDGDSTSELPALNTTAEISATAELELEPITHADDTAEIPSLQSSSVSSPEPEDPTLNVTMNEMTLAELSGGDEAGEAAEPTPATIEELQSDHADLLDETFHGVALDTNGVSPELFQETVQGEAFLPDDGSETWGETLPGIPAAQLAEDIGSEDQPTPVAAQTVFAATATTKSGGTGYRWAFGILLFLVCTAGSVLYFQGTTPLNRNMPSPQIAQGIEQVGPSLHETLKLDIKPEQAASQEELAGMDASEGMSGTLLSEIPGPEASGPGQGEIQSELAETAAATEQAETDATVDSEASEQSAVASEDESVPEEIAMPPSENKLASAADKLPPRFSADPSLIQISRSKVPEDKGKGLRDAYLAYQKGAYGTAAEKYQEILKQFTDNRDALLGLAAIAYNTGDSETAYRYYVRVLQTNPGDRYARAALINLQDKANITRNESVVTTMLHDRPDSHFLHFTLGNIYAAGSRWAEAQQAFFDAYRLNSTSPDYAMNLAVSLDHIGQYDAALDYYNVALELAKETPAGFENDTLTKRISKLQQTAEAEQ